MNGGEVKIVVLMSTYNGEDFLHEQLESIYSQSYNTFEIYVRDDGSSDKTKEILQFYKEKHDNFFWIAGHNLGVAYSFFELMRSIPLYDGIYLFADQDDIWMPHKLEHIVNIFSERDNQIPFLYCGDTILVDTDLSIIKNENLGVNIVPSFGNALIENICIGCTAAMNKVLFDLLIKHIPSYTVMHDWWFYLTASCFGEVYYDKEPLIMYRQHSKNAIGSSVTKMQKFITRVKQHEKHKGQIPRQARAFNLLYNVSMENADLLTCVEHYSKSLGMTMRLVKNKQICRQRKLDDLIFRLLYLFHQI